MRHNFTEIVFFKFLGLQINFQSTIDSTNKLIINCENIHEMSVIENEKKKINFYDVYYALMSLPLESLPYLKLEKY